MSLLHEALDAHGGLDRWRDLSRIRVKLRCGGIAMAMKGRPGVLGELDAAVDPRRPYVEFAQLGTFDGARGRPGGISRRVSWTDEDVVYFAGYALWNYLSAPFLLTGREISIEELGERRLRATFPPGFPTHSRQQVFHLGNDGRIERLDYTADVFGPWARAANRCLDYTEVDGLLFATRRRVVPRGLPGPSLVTIAIDEIRLD